MEIIVCIKQVPGTSEVKMDEHGNLIRSGIDSKMNPFDLFAIETALRMKQDGKASKVKVISMGPPQASAVIEESFWMGADEGVLLSDRKFAGADVWATSFTISQGIKKIGIPDLVICGKQTTDGDTAQVGAELAEFLQIPHVSNVLQIVKIKPKSIIVEIDLPTMVQVVEIEMPCLITVEKNIYMPRLPSFKRKIASKNLKVLTLAMKDLPDQSDLKYGMNGSPTKVQRVFPPESNTQHEIWRGQDVELAAKLFTKLKKGKYI
jgi:electron transfer flavoprotein beta subunit